VKANNHKIYKTQDQSGQKSK